MECRGAGEAGAEAEGGEGGGTECRESGEEGGAEYAGAGHGEDGQKGAAERYGEEGGEGTGQHGQAELYRRSAEDCETGEGGEGTEQGRCKTTAGHQQQHVVWEPYCKSGKSAGPACRWPAAASRSIRVAPDHPLLRFYLTPLRSTTGRTRSRQHRSPKRHFWSLVFT
ncbi:hypothetical protein GOP47_0012557 [Adiantum capillus-veneris]|uniref:Uncharacterized protein n=1 Tax=Adiantum capillus-veneris TaxID=13818 RepID=A0A9D4URJ7_ADICA|nr:hypothetical protein GOP47_0012557 [Adiantum capillus-veneris]